MTLVRLAEEFGENLVLIPAIKASNDQHKGWAIQKLREELGALDGKRVAILGLTYKPGTDTLRRSLAIEVCRLLEQEGVLLTVFDPVVSAMPADLARNSFIAKRQQDGSRRRWGGGQPRNGLNYSIRTGERISNR